MATSEDVENIEFCQKKIKEMNAKLETLETKKADILKGLEKKED